MNAVDSSGWIEYLHDGANADAFAPAIENVDLLIVPAIVIFEVFKFTLRTRGEKDAHTVAVAMRQGKLVEIDDTLALSAARISLANGLAMADSLILATAHAHNATLWTQDDDFEGLPDVQYFQKSI